MLFYFLEKIVFKGTSLRDVRVPSQFFVEAVPTTSIDPESSKLEYVVVIMSSESFLNKSMKHLFLGQLPLEPQCIFCIFCAHFDFTDLNNMSRKLRFKKIWPLLFHAYSYGIFYAEFYSCRLY